ncbi:MAG: ATP-binding protein, partial [Actinomycetota bacterium]
MTVLFADLVGFTSLSENRDAEEVRELLTRYFDVCRDLVARYGGTIEKFIGDAVMAVWGTPVAQEDDAERAVRTALDLTDAVAAMGEEVGAPDLRARAGVLTGEAAVTIGAEGQGMVAGDLVNTASRIQSAAHPGGVFVGESTRRSTEVSIAYEDAGEHTLKGKAEPMHLWRAARVVSGIAGAQKSEGLEAPFVGRERELRLIKDLFHATVEEGKAHLVSLTGIAGIGKSRLIWEFFKYIDGVATLFRWHRGRCLAYGEGVTYWALAEMVRTRAGILEGEDEQSAMDKLRDALEQSVPDPEERRFLEPRLAHLLGLEAHSARDRDELFSAWRLFYERLAEEMPTIMVFEDVQWADASLLDFIEYLLESSRNSRIFIITLGRPELSAKRPSWGSGKRGMTTLYLEPLSQQAMVDLMNGFVPGLPETARDRILARAEGVPMYAVETVRMLLDRGLLVQEGSVYRLSGPIDALEVPETLHALIAARLDGLTGEERRLVQDASVLGKTFMRASLAAVEGTAEAELDPLLAGLVRKEVLTLQADVRSPERGQYGFVQDLVRQVAYDTLSKKDRKARHLAAAQDLETRWGEEEDEIVEVLASHYLHAVKLFPDAEDVGEIKARARDKLERAGARAASLAATLEAQHYYQQAADLAEDVGDTAFLVEQAGQMAWIGGRNEEALALFEQAIELFESRGLTHPAARVSARIGDIGYFNGEVGPAIERMERSFALLSQEEKDPDLGILAAQIARAQFFSGDLETAHERVEFALDIAETMWLPGLISEALQTKGNILAARSRREESLALLERALAVALENDYPLSAARAYVNLSDRMTTYDRFDEAISFAGRGYELATRVGAERFRWSLVGNMFYPLFITGEWDEAFARMDLVRTPSGEFAVTTGQVNVSAIIQLLTERGRIDEAKETLKAFAHLGDSGDLQSKGGFELSCAVVARADGDHVTALRHAIKAMEGEPIFG